MYDAPLPVLIQFAAKRTSQMLEERFQRAGLAKLHPPLGQILGLLHANSKLTSADLQETLHLCKSTVSEALSELASRGLIEYVVNEEDRREKRIVETEKGKQYQESAWQILTKFREDVLCGLDEEEQKALRASLNTIIDNTKGGEHG